MILMALDHTRDFIHYDSFLHNALDLKTTSPALFFTRWITHYCAPVFIFLSGISIYLQSKRKSQGELSSFLWKRGIWLVFIELFVVSFLWTFDFSYKVFILQVIWAIGINMFLMSFLIRLNHSILIPLSIILIFGHNILDYFPEINRGNLMDLLFVGNFSTIVSGKTTFTIIYPFMPWLGVMLAGYLCGRIFTTEVSPEKRRKMLLISGISCISLFLILRSLNLYGNPFPRAVYENSVYSFLSLLNVQKYPPSLHFVLLTLGPALIFLSLKDRYSSKISSFIMIYGRVPFFYYLMHMLLIHLLSMVLFLSRGHGFFEQTEDIYGIPFRYMILGEGYSLSVVYVCWIMIVVVLYPVCKWFDKIKRSRKNSLLSYL